jgi:hypothetical protein
MLVQTAEMALPQALLAHQFLVLVVVVVLVMAERMELELQAVVMLVKAVQHLERLTLAVVVVV